MSCIRGNVFLDVFSFLSFQQYNFKNCFHPCFIFKLLFREIKNLDGQIIAENGNINCWKNLGADDQTDIRIAEVDFYDVCYTRRETSITNTTEETVIRRGVFYGQVDP